MFVLMTAPWMPLLSASVLLTILPACAEPVHASPVAVSSQVRMVYPYRDAESPAGIYSGLDAEVDPQREFAIQEAEVEGIPVEAKPGE